MIPARGPQTMFFCQWLLWNHCRVIGMLCCAMLLLACLLAAAVVYASTELLSEHNVPRLTTSNPGFQTIGFESIMKT